MTEWQSKALTLYEAGYPKVAIARQLQKEMGAPTVEHARDRVRKFLKKYPQPSIQPETEPTPKAQKHEALENLTPKRHVMDWLNIIFFLTIFNKFKHCQSPTFGTTKYAIVWFLLKLSAAAGALF